MINTQKTHLSQFNYCHGMEIISEILLKELIALQGILFWCDKNSIFLKSSYLQKFVNLEKSFLS